MGITTTVHFDLDKAKGEVKLFFQDPRQLLSIFTELENENLNLIQECREAEGNLEKIRNTVHEVISYFTLSSFVGPLTLYS